MDAQKMEALAGIVDEADAAAGPTAEQAQQQAEEVAAEAVAEQGAREWGMLAFTIGNTLAMFAPELKQVYTEDACLNWGRAAVPVAEKYGWAGVGKVPELGLALATVGLMAPTVVVIRHRLKNPEADKGGMLSALRAWWRGRKARAAADVARGVTDEAREVAQHGG